jgi:hypothetical protein
MVGTRCPKTAHVAVPGAKKRCSTLAVEFESEAVSNPAEEATTTSQLPASNAEQKLIVETIAEGNVCVDAVAGSGKTTLALKIAEEYSSKSVLLLTFNSRLKTETRLRAKAAGLVNLEAHSFHAFGVKFYQDVCKTDEDLSTVLGLRPRRQKIFDLIIIDEAQDLKDLFYRFVLKIFRDFADEKLTHVCVLGDAFQMVYEVFGADARFLQHSPECFPLNSARWFSRPMHTTYRLTRSMVHFINKCVIGQERLLCNKTNYDKVDLFEINWFKNDEQGLPRDVAVLWNSLLKKGYKDGEIMILAPSVKSSNLSSPVSRFAHYLCNRGHKLYVDQSRDDYRASEDEVANKILFTNFVKAKGLERRLVIVLSFDAGYFKYYAKDLSPQTVSNAMYVALTRAKEKLVLVKGSGSEHIPFLNLDILLSPVMRPFVELHSLARTQSPTTIASEKEVESIKVTELCDLPNRVLYSDRLSKLLHFRMLSRGIGCRMDEGTLLDFGSQEYNSSMDITEDTSCINGLAIPIFYAMKHPEVFDNLTARAVSAHRDMQKSLKSDAAKMLHSRLGDIVDTMEDAKRLQDTASEPSKVLLLASLMHCHRDSLFFPLLQLPADFSWLTSACFLGGELRLRSILQNQTSCVFEMDVDLECSSEEGGRRYELRGTLDCKTDQTIYELKCTQELTFTHKLQTALYALMVRQQHKKLSLGSRMPRVKLYNINTNELWELVSEESELWQVLQLLLHAKENPLRTLSTTDFLKNCRSFLADAGVSTRRRQDGVPATPGYPIIYMLREEEPGEDDEVLFDAMPDSEQAAIQEWYREGAGNASLPYRRWRALMDEREETRMQSAVEILRLRINALGNSSDATRLYDEHAFSSPLIQGYGGLLACGKCGLRLPKSEDEYLRKPQRIYCPHCIQSLAEKVEIRSQPHPCKGHPQLLCVPNKREFVFVPVKLPWQ